MNDPNTTTDDLQEDLETQFRELVEAGDPQALDYAIEHASPLWVAQEFTKRVAATEEMVAEWAEEADGTR
jgi:hypothetical protein